MARRSGLLAAALLGCLLALFVGAASASAHATVVSTSPADGARLKALPTAVSVTFDESVGLKLGYLRVVNATGNRVDTGSAAHPAGDDSTITVGVKAGGGDGTYLVSWRVISADSHPVAGSVRFVVGNGALQPVTESASRTTVSTTVSTLLALAHFLGFAGLALLGGSWLVFALWPDGRRLHRIRVLIWSGWTAALAGALAEFLIQGPYDAGSSPGNALRSAFLQSTLHSTTGNLISLRVLLLGLLGAALSMMLIPQDPVRTGWNLEAAALLGAGVVITYAASGHTQTANPRWFAILVDALHVLAASAWLGGLAVLVVAAYGRASHRDAAGSPDDLSGLDAAMPIFSRAALASVATLAVTGTIQAWREVAVLDALWQTTYGRLVLLKIGLLLVLTGLGYLARGHVQAGSAQAIDAGSGSTLVQVRPVGTVQRLRRTVLVEAIVGAVVLAVSSVLIFQAPGKAALDTQRSRPKTVTVRVTQSANAVVEISPGKHGPVQITVQLTGPIKPTSVVATATLPAKQLGPLPVPLQASGPNTYTANGVLLPSSGRWQIQLTVTTSAFDATTAVAAVGVS